jgi:hypothetical protein
VKRGEQDLACEWRGGLAARAVADEHHGDRYRRVGDGEERDEPGVGV